MATYRTGYMADEWLEFLKEKVEPNFPGITFGTYTPEKIIDKQQVKNTELISITIEDKSVFKYKLQGRSLTPFAVNRSLTHYVSETYGVSMVERYWLSASGKIAEPSYVM